MRYYIASRISENISETPEGYLLCIGVPIARTGEQVYSKDELPGLEADQNGMIMVQRDAEEVFRPETMASYEGKAVTIKHPEDFVKPENWSKLTKGIMQNIRRGDGENANDLLADLLITDKAAIELVKGGLREVSCGYDARYFQTGIGQAVQKEIVGNHLALVEEGRAGSAYAINDHKGKGSIKMKLKEKIEAIFARSKDEAMKVADEFGAEKKEDKKEEAKDEAKEDKKDDEKKESKDAVTKVYDELKSMMKDMSAKMEALSGGAKDESSKATMGQPAEVKAKDEESPAESSLEARLKALEDKLAALLEGEAEEEMGDEEGGYGEEKEEEPSKDNDFEESTMTGDTASRVEILSPGMNAKVKDAKVQALKSAYKTLDGKKAIDALTGGKLPTFDSAEKVDTLFIAASELLKVSRSSELSKSRQTRDSETAAPAKTVMTAEKMNELNAKFYNK